MRKGKAEIDIEEAPGGYIKVYRTIKKHWIWDHPDKVKWWLDIIMECNYSDKKVNIGNQLIECKRGQTLKSLSKWAKQWRVDINKVRRFLFLLQEDDMIVLENVNKTTRITVCNYNRFNDVTTPSLAKTKPDHKEESDSHGSNSTPTVSELYSILEQKDTKNICSFIKQHKPDFIEPYVDLWNLFAQKNNMAQVAKVTSERSKKLKARLKETQFDMITILTIANQCSRITEGKWFTFDWILKGESNYIKVLEGNYKNKTAPPTEKPAPAPSLTAKELA
jgi:hypothetical protein